MPQSGTAISFVVQLILFLFLYIKESIMETKHKKAGTSEEGKISLIKNLTIHNNTATIIVQYS